MSKFQSVYRRFHSCQTVLLRVQYDIIVSLNADRSTALLLDLSADFDTIEHNILHRLKWWFGFSSTVLNLLSLFLSDRSQTFVTSKLKSQPNLLGYSVPQCSVLGPLLYSLYTTPLLSVIYNHPGIQSHFYANNTQIHVSFSPEFTSLALSAIESCIRDVFSWMTSNKLCVNPNKTEYLLFNPSNINPPVILLILTLILFLTVILQKTLV